MGHGCDEWVRPEIVWEVSQSERVASVGVFWSRANNFTNQCLPIRDMPEICETGFNQAVFAKFFSQCRRVDDFKTCLAGLEKQKYCKYCLHLFIIINQSGFWGFGAQNPKTPSM